MHSIAMHIDDCISLSNQEGIPTRFFPSAIIAKIHKYSYVCGICLYLNEAERLIRINRVFSTNQGKQKRRKCRYMCCNIRVILLQRFRTTWARSEKRQVKILGQLTATQV